MPRKVLLAAVLLISIAACAYDRGVATNKYGLRVVGSLDEYRKSVRRNPNNRLVDLGRFVPDVRLDIRYATANNFMRRPLYSVARAYLRLPAAEALREVQLELAPRGIGLEIHDGYRPYRVTEAMWELYHDPDFVADPARGSRHNRGAAVDLTLIDLASGEELEMPTPYDDFTSRAAQSFMDLPSRVLDNRALLNDVMMRHGFEPLPSEWWHFDYRGWRDFDLMDIPLEELARE